MPGEHANGEEKAGKQAVTDKKETEVTESDILQAGADVLDAIKEFTEAVALIEAAVADIDEHTEVAKQTLTDHSMQLLAIMNDKITALVNSTVAVGITQIKAVAANVMAALGSAAKLAETYVDPKRKGY